MGGLTLRPARGPDAEGRWYWRAEVYLGDGRRETLAAAWWSADDAEREASRIHGDLERARADRASAAAEAELRRAERGRTVADLLEAWCRAMEEEARESIDRTVDAPSGAPRTVRLRRKLLDADPSLGRTRATRRIRSERTLVLNRRTAQAIARLVGERPVADADGAAEALEVGYVAACRGTPALTTLDLYLSTLRRAFVWARANGLVAVVPRIAGYDVDPQRDCKFEKWTPDRGELARILRAVEVVAGPRRRWGLPVIAMLAGTGLRVGELAALRVGDVDRERCVLRLPRRKGGQAATVALSQEVAEAVRPLVEGRDPAELLLRPRADCRTGIPRLSASVAALLKQAARHEGIPHRVTAHSLRRYASTLLLRVADGEYEDLMGHAKQVANDAYRMASLEAQRQALEAARLLPGAERLTP